MVTKGVIYKGGLMYHCCVGLPPSLITTGQSQQTYKQKELLLLLLWYPSGKNGPQSCYFPNPDHQARIVCMYVDSMYVYMYVCM